MLEYQVMLEEGAELFQTLSEENLERKMQIDELQTENQELRKQLQERDQVIEALVSRLETRRANR